ncbi:AzlC family ABC transporter permease [Lachnospiraceae bacterium MD1]|uniref:AzlC family ABC transporter permease n=1 Tax=Variimorphobacter saccharofermentans TaxID=2755051 RepID=A0A839JYB6_9FIRM|nr:AzlC family ABC transporter permease [Variimorphobacter saccharofermentans]MBB2181982.1 AzlC family ABC transporter permease [Variimorphobacter saccharofermentans]
MKKEFIYGLKRGYPIALGYIPVSFTFGLMAVSGGLPVWLTVFISMSNLTSAGQFAGTNLILQGAGFLEITLTTFIINIRYMLMSLSLTQRLGSDMTLLKRLIIGFGITDETFSVASLEQGKLSFPYLAGLILGPFLGWTAGTALGAIICSALPVTLSNAMGIALYGMFIAIIIPPAKKSRTVTIIILISVAVTVILRYVPLFRFISSGFRVIIATFLGAGLGAVLFPIEPKNEVDQNKGESIS